MTQIDTDTLAALLADATPGPWAAEGPLQSIIVWGPEPELRVCFMTSDGPARPNSKLIALAPELAAEVIALRARAAKDKARIERLEAALRFYTGRYEPALSCPNEGPWGVNSGDFGAVAIAALEDRE